MALQANRIHIGSVQQPRIRPAVRRVACSAALGLDHRVLIHKRAGRLRVALGAHRVLLRGTHKALPSKGAVRVVAVGALYQSLFHFVMEGHGELRLDISVALETKLRLSGLEQVLRDARSVNAVAGDAAYIAFSVSRALKVRVLSLVAAEALLVHFFRCCLGRVEDLRYIAAAVNVRFAGTMTPFAGDPGSAMQY